MLKAKIEKLKEENSDKINELTKFHLLERDGLQKENITLKHTVDVIHFNKYKELTDIYKIEVNLLLSLISDLKKQLASRESSDDALAGNTQELIKHNTHIKELKAYINEMKEIVNKANVHKREIKIRYDNLLTIIAEKDNHIKLQKHQIQELKRAML